LKVLNPTSKANLKAKLKTHNMAHRQRTPFTLKSGNKTSFKAMGSSPMQIRFASPEAGATQQGPNTIMNAQAPANSDP
jgi:hypothetical protein